MTKPVLPPQLPLDQEVQWRHYLVYGQLTRDEAYRVGRFASDLEHAIERREAHTGPPRSTVKEQIALAYRQGVEVGRQEACGCDRCASYSDEQLRSLHQPEITVGPLTLYSDGRIDPIDSEKGVTPTEHGLLVSLLRAYPSYAGWHSLLPVGRNGLISQDRHVARVHFARLRTRIAAYGLRIVNVPGLGYRLVKEGS